MSPRKTPGQGHDCSEVSNSAKQVKLRKEACSPVIFASMSLCHFLQELQPVQERNVSRTGQELLCHYRLAKLSLIYIE